MTSPIVPIKESVKYNFTLTLRPLQYVHTPIEQLNNTAHILVNLLRIELHVVNVSLCFELTNQMNIHYHGVFTVNLHKYRNTLVLNKFSNMLRKKCNSQYFGSSRCYQTQYEKESLLYLTKDIFKSYALLNRMRYPMLLDDYHIDDHFTFQLRFSEWLKTAREEYNNVVPE